MPRLLLAALLVALCAEPASAQTPDMSSPGATVRSFVTAVDKLDFRTAVRCVSGARYDLDVAASQAIAHKWHVHVALTALSTTVSGSKAVAALTIATRATPGDKPSSYRDTLELMKEAGGWRIVPPDPSAPPGRAVKPRSYVSSAVATLLHRDVLGHALATAHKTECLANVKRICVGVLELVHYGDETFDLSTGSLRKKLKGFVDRDDTFSCPDHQAPGEAYSFNDRLSGRTCGAVKHPERTVMIYEGAGGKLAYRHDGYAMVGFVDGHARPISPPDADSLLWKP